MIVPVCRRAYEYRSAAITAELPTAVQAAVELHDTPASWICFWVAWIAQLVPFQASAKPPPFWPKSDPTAMQAFVVGHDTPLSTVSPGPVGFGVVWIAQLVPFHRSANVSSRPPTPTWVVPTAVQAAVEVHETAKSSLSAGFGVVWIDQLVPFQASATVQTVSGSALVTKVPTAVHAFIEVHDTPDRLPDEPVGSWLAVVWIDQLVPFQRSANRDPPAESPTAVQAVDEVHDTPKSWLPAGFGVLWTDQLVPFHRSARAATLVPVSGSPVYPTAVQAAGEGHDTATRALATTPGGLELVWIDQPVPFQRSAKPTLPAVPPK